jgi:hypothetical protein
MEAANKMTTTQKANQKTALCSSPGAGRRCISGAAAEGASLESEALDSEVAIATIPDNTVNATISSRTDRTENRPDKWLSPSVLSVLGLVLGSHPKCT